MKKAVVIGAGFAGLSAASFLARAGWNVTVLEKHEQPGGRCRTYADAGFTFDMGPSWYWMPDVFERYFASFGKSVSDYYTLKRLDPSYRVYFSDGPLDIPADYGRLRDLFESIEPGSALQLDRFMKEAAYKYEVGMQKLVFKPGQSLTEFLDLDLFRGLLKLDVFTSMKAHVGRFFRDPRLVRLMEFPVLFLGAMPADIPALYSLMNYADIKLGTWYPEGGMSRIPAAMHQLAVELGVTFRFQAEVSQIQVEGGKARSVVAREQGVETRYEADVVVGAADYHFIETRLLEPRFRSYSEKYWEKRVMAPSCLLFYVGLSKKLNHLAHHTLFFDADFERHGSEIYENPRWPADPLFYVSATSVSDSTVAPPGGENLFFLIPVAAGLAEDHEERREQYLRQIVSRYERHIGQPINDSIIHCRTYSVSDFRNDYHAFRGNAYGLANTLMQTSILKPSLRSRKVDNLYYTGQLTVPGPGVPPCLISGEVVAAEILSRHN